MSLISRAVRPSCSSLRIKMKMKIEKKMRGGEEGEEEEQE